MPVHPRPAEERFWPKVDRRGPDECWLWTGAKNPQGYGNFWTREDGSVNAHRMAYRLLRPDVDLTGLVLDHLCRTPACVNPNHLEPVTLLENFRRGEGAVMQAVRTGRCKRGHDISIEANVYRYASNNYTRQCRLCAALRRNGGAA